MVERRSGEALSEVGSSEFPLTKGGKKAKRQRSLRLQGVVVTVLRRPDRTTPALRDRVSSRPLC